MKMENIMNYKTYLYVVTTLLSAFALGGVNFDKFMKKNKTIEARIIVIIFSFICGYLLTNFITDFIYVSKIV